MTAVSLSALFIHPVKSCRGIAVTHALVDHHGIAGDRRFLIVDAQDRFVTQRSHPRLAHIEATHADGMLALSAPGTPAVHIPTDAAQYPARAVEIWRDTVRANDLGDEAAAWLSQLLGQTMRLVTCGPEFSRPVPAATASAGDELAFADAHPLLIIGEESLAALNDRLDEALPMNRFRPNLVVRGCAAHDEDRWKRIRIGDVVLRASGPCARCIVTTTDQTSLERGKEPLRTLAQYRRAAGGEINFGQNYINESKSGCLAVGTTVEVLD